MAASRTFRGASYAAHNLRYDYYRNMASLMVMAVQSRAAQTQNQLKQIADIGAGIGVSTKVILDSLNPDLLVAVEAEESMLEFMRLLLMGDPRVRMRQGRAESFSDAIQQYLPQADAIFFCQMIHILNAPKGSLVPKALAEAGKVLRLGGVIAFDLASSHYQFELSLADHIGSKRSAGEILTELAHPLMQRAHEIMLELVKNEYPDFDREHLWPVPANRMKRSLLKTHLTRAGFSDMQVREELLPISGQEEIEFVRKWSLETFLRWPPLDTLPLERKLEIIGLMAERLFQQPEFTSWEHVVAYHPTAIITAIDMSQLI